MENNSTKIESLSNIEDVEDIDKKIELLKNQEQIVGLERDFEQAGDTLEKIVNNPMMSDPKVPIEQKSKFLKKAKKLTMFMPLVVSGILSLAGMFGKGGNVGQDFENTQSAQSFKNLMKIGEVVSDIDKKQQNREEKSAHPFGTVKEMVDQNL